MLRIAIAAVLIAASAVPAAAYCPSTPDDANSQFVSNSTDHLLCLQQELSNTTERMELEARWKAQIEALTIEQTKLAPFPAFGSF